MRLLVPIAVDALVVRSLEGQRLADLRMRDPDGDGPAGDLMPPPFTEREPRPLGVHLHWAMPDALTRAVEADDAIQLPALPDRWLVVRLSPSSKQRLVRGWVIVAGGSKPSVTEFERFREPGSKTDARAPLTTFGHGHPAWAAIADSAEGRLTLHDPLDDVAEGAISYLVCGWHADPGLDPLGSSFAAGRERRAEALKWRTPTGALPGSDVTGSTLYHGSVVGLGWPSAELGVLGAEVGGPPSADVLRVVVASTLSEALATTRSTLDPFHDRVITAVVAGIQDQLALPDGRRRIDDGLHARTFVSFAGGTRTETVWEPPSEPQGTPPGRPPVVGPFADVVVGTVLTQAEAPPIRVVSHTPRFDQAITSVLSVPLDLVLDTVGPPPPPPPSPGTPGRFVEVVRPLPPFYAPADPVVLVEGAGRSFRHGGDGRFSTDETLQCRWAGSCVTGMSVAGKLVTGASLLDRQLDNPDLPAECNELLRELVVLDPGSAATAKTLHDLDPEVVAVEQTAWWAMRERRLDVLPLLVHSGLVGTLPSPVACTPPVSPWTPLILEWEGELLPSLHPWPLGEIDREPPDLETGAPVDVSGRVLLGPGAARLAGAMARTVRSDVLRIGTGTVLPMLHRPAFASDVAGRLSDVLGGLDLAGAIDELAPIEEQLDDGDWISGSLDPLNTAFRGGIPGDGESVGEPAGPFLASRAGFLRINRLRLIDGFGQYLDVDPARIEWGTSLSVDGAPELALLPTRFTSPTRVRLAYRDASGVARDADDLVSPLCGWLLPDILDGALEVFDPDGRSIGQVRKTDAALAWELSPGTPGTVGLQPERTLGNPFVAGLVRGLLDHGVADGAEPEREDVLSALLRVVDATRWATDPFAHTGEEHLSLLVGHPIAVLRAELSLEVREPVAPSTDEVDVHIGSLAHWQDGVLGFFVDDDYRVLHLPDGASARFAREVGPDRGFLQRVDLAMAHFASFTDDLGDPQGEGAVPVSHPLVDPSGVIRLRPGQVRRLTLLVEPHAVVHVRSGIVPSSVVPMRRPWVAAGLANLAPTFRFGPLLLDPHVVRMPVPTRGGGGWSWESRSAPDAWLSEEVATGAGEVALSAMPPRAMEGWLRFVPDPVEEP